MSPLPALILLRLLACHDKGAAPADSAPPADSASAHTVPLAGPCAQAEDYGGFVVSVSESSSDLDGAVADGVVPTSVLTEIAAEGDCALMRRENPFCDPACDPGQTCDLSGACVPYPSNQDLGTVTVTGLAETLTLEPVFPGNTYYNTEMVHPTFTGGELITLSMPGGVYGPVELHGVGVEALDATGLAWTLQEGVDTSITWPAPADPGARSSVLIAVSIDQHGLTPSTLVCTFDDDGEGLVPAAVVNAMLAAGVTGFPSGSITRRTADHAAAGAGCMDLTVASGRTVPVDVIGYTPCVSDAECPDGQTCDLELQICE